MSTITPSRPQLEIENRFRSTRRRTVALCEPLSAEDMMVQSCAEASPAKWHLAHTAWFFESFMCCGNSWPGYRLFNVGFCVAVQQLLSRALRRFRRSGCGPSFSRDPDWRRFCVTGSMWTLRLSGCWQAKSAAGGAEAD
jgi:hypothetical protein